MKMKHAFGPIILACVLFFIIILIPSKSLVSLISDKKVEDAATSLQKEKLQSVFLQQKMLENSQYLPMYGSSEFLRMDAYHPSNYFKVNPAGFTPYLMGIGGTQSLAHILNMTSTMDELEGKKVVFVLSPQWFTKTGVSQGDFTNNFSKQQAYHFIFNDTINVEMKKQIAKRLLDYKVVQKDDILKNSLEGIVYNDTKHNIKAGLVKPLAYMHRNILDHRDVFNSLFKIEPMKEKTNMGLRSISWVDARKHAEEEGKTESTTNTFGIENPYYYKHNLKKKLKGLKNFRANESYEESPEYDDLQIVLNIFKEKNVKPLFISVPVNGPWYDYAGFPKERREVYYKKVREQVEKAGYPVVDFSGHEYDKYFLKDTIHLGWKGWIYFDEAVQKFYTEK
ncbi:D-alanyl-lipoteichoic acid biosynthesis protein DltD [Bacillus wiedmannii]|uniref:Protein DltD n=4 Tax=Bacillus cereus group TaxID=86661 RepID=A0A1C4EJA8_BACTU|nr:MULTISPECIES: D-alanyl-lipoteichoic acid biosynthesis protein DltD [Bacillus]MCC2327300.1 D-alanyl-lipoteichoic acid biosynthesis protein DltD [Bacillus wiedmannii]MED2016194.1 D-alanyl-lipoteichoic acid biosynthesis protein DltD [Bacillus wiedmannii]MED2886006.1 D-alanyl-lipoteichoic acid biosynthesis protein DltD [Bacillus wiedmannii]MED3024361.1 D-alanyl-lipoteichoic acid biosynthesis protein DltD [Bacillus wiedmannii]OTY03002.1 D-alanyl-lipoteichoic acid biosynthesis protein DltD [Bacil